MAKAIYLSNKTVYQPPPSPSPGTDKVYCINEGIGISESINGGGVFHFAASPAFSDVQAAVNAATDGDTVIIPAGTATWNNQLVVTIGVNIIAAGLGQTVITSAYGGSGSYWLVMYQPASPAADVPFRLSGFEWNLNGMSNWLYMENKTLHPVTKTRIDNNKVYGSPGPSNLILREGMVYGVGDHNDITFNPIGANQLMDNLGLQDQDWNYTTFTPGGADNFYWEDNDFTTTCGITACGQGGRYCFRHNTITYNGPTGTWQIFDMHGNQSGLIYATMGGEIYENTIVTNSNEQLLDQRGGIALVYNNTVTSPSGGGWIKIREELNDNACPTNGRTDGADAIDGQPQHVSGSYYWGNTHNGNKITLYLTTQVDYGGAIGLVPRPDIDYFDVAVPFDGSSGMGIGLLSARPASCALTGAGYWATDTKTLYVWNGSAWTAYYTPYTYPHPLQAILG